MILTFKCRNCGSDITTKDFKDKVAEACDSCGIIWEAKPDGTVELELTQLVGGKYTDGRLRDPAGMRESAIPGIIRKAALKDVVK